MFEVNAMDRLSSFIKLKNSRICGVLDIDNIPDFFKDNFSSEQSEVVYEYAITYLQAIAENVPAVKIIAKEKEKLYWDIVEAAKYLGLFVICEVHQEEIEFSYILESRTKMIIENVDAVIIDLSDNLEIERFIKLLKEKKKGVFINIRNNETQEESKKKTKRRLFTKKAPKITNSPKDSFFRLSNKIERNCYDQNGELTYLMIGLVIMRPDQKYILTPYNYAMINDEIETEDIVSIADADGMGILVTNDLYPEHSTDDFFEQIRQEARKKTEKINNAINKFYGIEE